MPRLELAIINEAYRAAGDGVADPRDIDLAMRLGAGHRRVPFERARALGLGTVVRGLRRARASATVNATAWPQRSGRSPPSEAGRTGGGRTHPCRALRLGSG